MLNAIKSQFGHPRGWIGGLVGRVMAVENRERIVWAVQNLDVQPDDHVLEIGFGPGVGIGLLASRAAQVSGVDISDVMVRQAIKRNAEGVHSGQIELRPGSATAIPFADATFDRVMTINSFHHWSDKGAGLAECARVLKPGGLLAIVEQPPVKAADSAAMQTRAQVIVDALSAAGFNDVTIYSEGLQRGWAAIVRGVR